MRSFLLFFVVGLLGCGARSGLASIEAASDATVDSARDVSVEPDVPFETSTRCAAAAESLATKIDPAVGSCTTVVRVSKATNAITGYRLLCAPYGTIDEASARKRSQIDTGIGMVACFESPSITGSTPKDQFVFFQPASAAACACCGDGWVTAVSARTATTVLGGVISFGDGKGLVFPEKWDDPSDLGVGCATSIPRVAVRGFDLTKMGSPGTKPPALTADEMDAPMRAVWSTALPEAWAKKHYLFDGVLLEYASSAASDAKTEWIVMIDTGWLE